MAALIRFLLVVAHLWLPSRRLGSEGGAAALKTEIAPGANLTGRFQKGHVNVWFSVYHW
jgi:hypothetical protein